MTKKAIIITAIVIILGFVGYKVLADKEEPTKLDIWNEIGVLKLEIEDLNNQVKIKTEKKEQLLQQFNGTGDNGKLSQ